MAKKERCKTCHARGANIGADGRCCGCRMALWATEQGLRYGALMARLHEQKADIENMEVPGLPPVRDNRRHLR